MAPGALSTQSSKSRKSTPSRVSAVATTIKNCLFNRSISVRPYRVVVRGYRHTYELGDGTKIDDVSCGACVSSLGRVQERVIQAMNKQMRLGLSYVPSLAFDTKAALDLAQFMITSTNGQMSKAIFYCSGSEASEAALKIMIQYHAKEKSCPQPQRTKFIARERSYHGATLGALDLSGHDARKALYEPILPGNMALIPPCYPYRDLQNGQTIEEYVEELKRQLVRKIMELGEDNVAGFIVEPVVGAALGCVAAVPGYLKAMREVCDQYGILLVFDEVMCGMGRTGWLHAWQKDNVVPDIQLVGKGLAAGFQPISAMLIGHKIINAFQQGPSNSAFQHGHTFQNYPLAAAAALAVQKIIEDDGLLENVREKGKLLEKKLKKGLGDHRYVGDIRGEGLFWGIEFVEDKRTKRPFDAKRMVNEEIFQLGLNHGIHVYPGGGTADGKNGDHIIVAPAFDVTTQELTSIVERVTRLVENYFDDLDLKNHQTTP
ncbi:aminotransferase, class III [Cucurbitaria berberidis CBS 394.84]|uniref:Aminotransferase, class III n=1 Tax=Cucurbitaria berberidis CBS 394.84 TaxID=1168544 RepID=A0A9P4GE89_9PLEO|nr:aminotransferase, class III [Cucurbitaria berberidis CBS 394.84]KAF1844368.1 aminotransferase, class III [Cucurbitaria berberidis CBS 394.84]